MGRRSPGRLDALLESWARWCARDDGGFDLGASGRTILARWMDSKGDLLFGGGLGASVPADHIESLIDEAVHILGLADPLAADVLRLEADAGWGKVVERRGIRGYSPINARQLEKALALGVSLRTYKGRLAKAREFVAARIKVPV